MVRRSALSAFGGKTAFQRDILPALAARGRVGGAVKAGYFLDIGVPETYEAAQIEVPASLGRGALFLDRDGVLNEDDGYVHRIEQVRWVEGAVQAVRLANDLGLFVFVVTNQSGVARGYYEERHVRDLHQEMQSQLRAAGAHIDDFRFCPHHLKGVQPRYAVACNWRKPGPGMILDLERHWPVDIAASLLIGDQDTDLAAAAAAGVRAVRFRGGALDRLAADNLDPANPAQRPPG